MEVVELDQMIPKHREKDGVEKRKQRMEEKRKKRSLLLSFPCHNPTGNPLKLVSGKQQSYRKP